MPHGSSLRRPFAASLAMHSRVRAARIGLVFAMIGVASACRDEASDGPGAHSSAILPSMLPAQASNADATPPQVPFVAATPVWRGRARVSWPHDTSAYTQGLLLDGDRLLESTGREGRSDIRAVVRRTGRVIARTPLPALAFGEGLAVAGGRAYQLTWKGGCGFVYDVRTLARVDSFTFAGEGWGLAAAETLLYMSDGSDTIRVVDPRGFRELRRIPVREGGKPVWMLNELELVGDELWANVYETNLIARIRPSTGEIIGWVDLAGLLTAAERGDVERRGGVANGIAFDAARRVVLVTGKLWPRVFELDMREIVGHR